MRQEILDTNVLLRFLVGDNPKQQKIAEGWFKEGQTKKRHIVVAALVVAEAVFVLESFYKKDRAEIANALSVFVSQKWLYVKEREILLKALEQYSLGLHMVDSFLLALAKTQEGGILTFDQSLLKKLANS